MKSWRLQRRPRVLVAVLLAVLFVYFFFAQAKNQFINANQRRRATKQQNDVHRAFERKIERYRFPTVFRKSSHYSINDQIGEIVAIASKERAKIKKHELRTTHNDNNIKPLKHRFRFLEKVKTHDDANSNKRKKDSIKNDSNVENKVRNEEICKTGFHYGEMCPPLYTELGGYCEHVKAHGAVLDCPDIRRKGRTKLRSTQLVLTRMLKIFDVIAQEYNITYWITSGTLLGATRHHGFIPWDEDADIQMFLADYLKLFQCCKDVFPRGVFFQNSETDIHLGPSDHSKKKLLSHPLVGLYKTPWNPRLRDMKSCTRYCLSEKCKWEDGIMIDIFIAEDTLTSHERNKVFPLKQMIFEGFRFPVPSNWRQILQDKYGDYQSDIGEDDSRQPQDNADPHHSCRQLKKRLKKRKKKKTQKRKNVNHSIEEEINT